MLPVLETSPRRVQELEEFAPKHEEVRMNKPITSASGPSALQANEKRCDQINIVAAVTNGPYVISLFQNISPPQWDTLIMFVYNRKHPLSKKELKS